MENIFEYLIPLIFILSFFNYRKKKKQRAAEKDADQAVKKSDGLFGKLNKMMEEYQKSDLKGAPVEKDNSGTWAENPTDPETVYKEPEPWEDEDEVRVPAEMRIIPQETVSHPRLVKQASPTPVVDPLQKIEPQRPDVQVEKAVAVKPIASEPEVLASDFSKMRKADLRKAIVWSEILAPPKALREN